MHALALAFLFLAPPLAHAATEKAAVSLLSADAAVDARLAPLVTGSIQREVVLSQAFEAVVETPAGVLSADCQASDSCLAAAASTRGTAWMVAGRLSPMTDGVDVDLLLYHADDGVVGRAHTHLAVSADGAPAGDWEASVREATLTLAGEARLHGAHGARAMGAADEPAGKRRWYGYQIWLADACSTALVLSSGDGNLGRILGFSGYIGAPIALHAVHRNVTGAIASPLMRVSAPLLFGYGMAQLDDSGDDLATVGFFIVGAGLGAAGAMIVDGAAFGWTPASRSTGIGVTPMAGPQMQGLLLGGRF